MNDVHSLLTTNTKLLGIRAESRPLQWGSLKWLEEFSSGDILAYQRIYLQEMVSVLINVSDKEQRLDIDPASTLLFATGKAELNGDQLVLGPNSGVILK